MNSQDESSPTGPSSVEGLGPHAATPGPKISIKPIVRILEHSVQEFRLEFEPSESRRVVAEVVRTWPGTVESRWWKWLVEAGESLDLRVAVVECPLADALWWVEEGMHLVAFIENQAEPWLVVDGVQASAAFADDIQFIRRPSARQAIVAFRVQHEHDGLGGVDNTFAQFVRAAERLFGLLSLGDILADSGAARERSQRTSPSGRKIRNSIA